MKLKNNLYTINSSNTTDNGYCYNLSLINDSVIYAAHFPGKPITPGVCLIQIAHELLEQSLGKSLEIVAVKNVKFLSVLSPQATQAVDVMLEKIVTTGDQVSAMATILDATTRYARISFTCRTL